MRAVQPGASWGGLLAGPLAWTVSTQLNYVLVPWQCTHGVQLVPMLSVILAVLALLGGVLSWHAGRIGRAAFRPEREGVQRFIATLGMLAAGLFALVILAQGSAGLVLDGCVR